MLAPQTSQMAIQQVAPDTYTTQTHKDWTMGTGKFYWFDLELFTWLDRPAYFVIDSVALGSALAAQLYQVALTHCGNDEKLKASNQKDILTLHVQFLRPGITGESKVVVEAVKYGPMTCNLELRLYQKEKLRVLAVASTTNFDNAIGPSSTTNWSHAMVSKNPYRDFAKMRAGQQDDNRWMPMYPNNQLGPHFRSWRYVHAHGHDQENKMIKEPLNTFHGWLGNMDGSWFDMVGVVMAQDCLPSIHDSMLQNKGPISVTNFFGRAQKSYDQGDRPAVATITTKDMQQVAHFQFHVAMDFTFMKRMPADGLEWILLHGECKKLEKGRMDVDVEVFDLQKDLVCICRQTQLITDLGRRLPGKKEKASL